MTQSVGKLYPASTLSGDLGDDRITLNTNAASKVMGGDGDDTITSAQADASEKGHTIVGGAGNDDITVDGIAVGTQDDDYELDKGTTILSYASAAELFESDELVDSITTGAGKVAIAEVAEALNVTTATDFSNATARTANDGLILKTSATVTTGSSVILSEDAGTYIFGVDTSAATGGSEINASKVTTAMLLEGGQGKNTITGGDGADVIVGGATKDTLTGGDGNDRIVTGKGDDVIAGGDGNDTIVMGLYFDQGKSITAGDGTDELSFTYTEKAITALGKIAAAIDKSTTDDLTEADFEVITFDKGAAAPTPSMMDWSKTAHSLLPWKLEAPRL